MYSDLFHSILFNEKKPPKNKKPHLGPNKWPTVCKKSWSGHPLGFIRTWRVIPCWLGPPLAPTGSKLWVCVTPSVKPTGLVVLARGPLLSSQSTRGTQPHSSFCLIRLQCWAEEAVFQAGADPLFLGLWMMEGDGHKHIPLHSGVAPLSRGRIHCLLLLSPFSFPSLTGPRKRWAFLSLPLHHLILLPSRQKD